MKAFSFVLLVLSASVLAVHYELPKLPCGWTFTMSLDDDLKGYDVTIHVNGRFMNYTMTEPKDFYFMIIRSDLGDSESTVKEFIHSDDEPNFTEVVEFDRLKEFYQPLLPKGDPFSFDFDHVVDSTFHGKKCKKYYNDPDNPNDDIFYADLNGFPLGLTDADSEHECLMSFDSTVPPLRLFAFDKSVEFEDTRIYTPPKQSICSTSSSSTSASSRQTVSSLVFALLLVATIFILH